MDFAAADLAFYGCVFGGVELEVCVPLFRPGGQEQNLVAVGLQEHSLQCGHCARPVVLVGYPVEVRSPECGESAAGVACREVFADVLCGVLCEAQVGGLDGILPPAHGFFYGAALPCLQCDVESARGQAVEAIGEDGVELGIL